ncbi:MAG: DUF429 domain-containing protein, partial [Gammaproteobacteria bacterium]
MVRMGVDGCRGGWLIAKTEGERDDFSTLSLSVVPTLAEAFKERAFKEKAFKEKAAQLVLIDMPKGLLSDKARKIEG